MAVASAHDVAAAIRDRLPGVGLKKLHKLLYFAQGFHLVHAREPLFAETIEAWEHGPVVADVWRLERFVSTRRAGPLDNGQLNTVGYVVSRYGTNSGRELETITHNSGPWRHARRRMLGGKRRHDIAVAALRDHFETVVAAERADDEVPLDLAAISRFLAGAREREHLPGTPDTLESLRARMAGG